MAAVTSIQPVAPVKSSKRGATVTFSASVSSIAASSSSRKKTPADVSCSISVEDEVQNWASELRRRLTTDERPSSDLVRDFRREVGVLFIVVLQQDNRIAWRYLLACLPLLEPHKKYLQNVCEFQHYVNRAVHHAEQHPSRFGTQDLVSALRQVFPTEVAAAQKPSRDFQSPPKRVVETKQKSPRTPRLYMPPGKDPFRLDIYEKSEEGTPGLLTFGDIRQSLPNVGLEVADRESIWGHSTGRIAQAMDTDLLDDIPEVTAGSRELSAGDPEHRVESAPVEGATNAERKSWCPRQTGRQAVQYFTGCYHTGQIKYQYFNVVPNKFHNPYDLISTPKNKADPEHYVFSTFGVLHVKPSHDSENLTLLEWQREAVLWTATSKIPYFRNYLIRKMFGRWRENVRHISLVKTRENLGLSLVQSVPLFGHALLQLSGLLQELETLTFLPFDTEKSFELSQFEDEITLKNAKAEAVLDQFYRFVKLIIDSTGRAALKRLKHAEEQAEHRIEFSRESLHLQKLKKEQRAENLAKARHEAGQLGNFVKLVDQLVLARLVAIARTNTETFVNRVMADGHSSRDGLLRAKLVFNDKDHLELSPGREKFIRTLGRALGEIPSVLCEAALTIADSMGIGRANSSRASTPSSGGFDDQVAGPRHDVIRRQGIPDLAEGLDSQPSARSEKAQEPVGEPPETEEEKPEVTVTVEKRVRLVTPEIVEDAPPRKCDDVMGIATPDLVQDGKTPAHLEVEGQGFLGQYTPLHHGNLDDKLVHDASYKAALELHARLLNDSLEELDQYCSDNRWLEEIRVYCNQWGDTSTVDWQGAPSFNIEQQLAKLKNWTERVMSFDSFMITENGVLYVDCSEVQGCLVPRLQAIFAELAQFVGDQAKLLGGYFIDDMKLIIENLRSKSTDVNRFAQYTKDVAMYKSRTLEYQNRQDYIKSLLEVIRMSHRQLTPEEEALEAKLAACWEDFLFCIQEANQYIATETPAITRMLEDTYQARRKRHPRPPLAQERFVRGVNLVSNTPQFLDVVASAWRIAKSPSSIMKSLLRTGSAPPNYPSPTPAQTPAHSFRGTTRSDLSATDPTFSDSRSDFSEKAEYRSVEEVLEKVGSENPDGTPSRVKIQVSEETWERCRWCLQYSVQLEEQLYALYTGSLSAEFLTPSDKPEPLIAQLKEILYAFYKVRDNLILMSENKKEIMGEPLDLDYVQPMMVSIETRYELWKYIDISANSIREWKKMLFRKMNVRQVHDKVGVWQLAAFKMKGHLPADDRLLQSFYVTLQEFKHDLPLLHKLSNPAMKAKHWRSVFIGMGEPYDPSSNLTVQDLLSYKLGKHSALINTIYSNALAEYKLELKLQKIGKLWSERQLKLAKHVPDSVYYDSTSGVPAKGMTRIEKFRLERNRSARKKGLDLSSEDLYVLTDVEELLYLIQDSVITLQTMLSSRHLAAIRGDAENWHQRLRHLQELVGTWLVCQDKWLYLLKSFDQYEFYKSFGEKTVLFDDIHQRYKDFIKSVADDPRALSMVKSDRTLHGEALKLYLKTLIRDQEQLEVLLDKKVSRACLDYPRLYFLSREEVMEIISVSRNPDRLLRSIRKLFPGVHHVNYSLPNTNSVSQLDVLLNADKLCATSIVSAMNELVPLTTKVESNRSNTAWLAAMETAMKVTMATILRATIDARLAQGTEVPESVELLEELAKLEPSTSDPAVGDLRNEVQSQFQHWLLRFPAQSVMVAESVLWSRDVESALSKQSRPELEKIFDRLVQKIQCYSNALRGNSGSRHGNETKCRLHVLLGNLIAQAGYHRDAVRVLLDSGEDLSNRDYDWLRLLRYDLSVTSMLRARTLEAETVIRTETLSPLQVTRSRSFTLERAADVDQSETKARETELSHVNHYGNLRLQQLGQVHLYDYEYLGPDQCTLAATPLTDRALLTLNVALKHFQIGTLTGACAKGKTATIHYLAQLMGRHVVLVNCTESLSPTTMVHYLHGLVQSGSWLLLDEAQDLNLGLLSLLAQHLDALRLSFRSRDNVASIYDKHLKSLVKKQNRHSVPALHSHTEQTQKPETEDGSHRLGPRHSIDRDQDLHTYTPYQHGGKPPPLVEDVIDENGEWAELQPAYSAAYFDDVTFDGTLMKARATYGCFMTLNSESRKYCQIPECMKVLMRPCCLIEPDLRAIVEIRLLRAGFLHHGILTTKFCLMVELLKTQMPDRAEYSINLRVIGQMLQIADVKLSTPRSYHEARQEAELGPDALSDIQSEAGSSSALVQEEQEQEEDHVMAVYTPRPDADQDDQSREEYALIYGLVNVMTSRITCRQDMTHFRSLLRDVFPVTARPKSGMASHDPALVSAIQEEMVNSGLQATSQHVAKILQLYSALEYNTGVVLSGICGSGKTSCYQILSRAINSLTTVKADVQDDELHDEKSFSPSRVKLISGERVISPNTQLWKKRTYAVKRMNRMYKGLLETKSEVAYPRVDTTRLSPGSLTNEQLFGHLSQDGAWQTGLLTKLVQSANQQAVASDHVIANSQSKRLRDIDEPIRIENWLVLDGVVQSEWADGMGTLLEERRRMSLASRETLSVEASVSVILETTDLKNASPAILSKCSSVHLESTDLHWSWLIESWGPQAKQNFLITGASVRLIIELANSVFPETLYFMSDCRRSLPLEGATVEGVAEVTSFLHILSALLQRHLLRDDWEKALVQQRKQSAVTPTRTRTSASGSRVGSSLRVEENVMNYVAIIKSMFAYAFIWAFGGQLHESHKERFDNHARSILSRAAHPVKVPQQGSVFEYGVDAKAGTLVRWEPKQEGKAKATGSQYIMLPQMEAYVYLMELLLGYNQPFLLVGAPGCGKTSLLQNSIFPKYQYTRLALAPDYHPERLYQSVRVHVDELRQKRGQVLYGNKMVSRHLFLLDDMNMAGMDQDRGIQPTLELLRHALSSNGMYDYDDLVHREYKEASFIGACTTPNAPGCGYGVSSHAPSARLCRLMIVLTLVTPSDQDCHQIYGRIVQGWLDEFPTYSLHHTKELGKAMIGGLVDVYNSLRVTLPPSVTSQNLLSLHQVAQTVQGLLLFSPRQRPANKVTPRPSVSKRSNKKASVISRETTISQSEAPVMMRPLVRLWCHEVTRTFGDRLQSERDLTLFKKTLHDVVEKRFCSETLSTQQSEAPPGGQVAGEEEEAELPTSQPGSRPHTSGSSVPKSLTSSPRHSRPASSTTLSELTSPQPLNTGLPESDVAMPGERPSDVPELGLGNEVTGSGGDEVEGVGSTGNEVEPAGSGRNEVGVDKKSSTTVAPGSASAPTEEETTNRTAETESSASSESSSDSDSDSVSFNARSKRKNRQNASVTPTRPVSQPHTVSSLSTDIPVYHGVGGSSRSTTTPAGRVSKRGVTFKGDRKEEEFTGPLYNMEQICDQGEQLTDFVFSRQILTFATEMQGQPVDKGYSEAPLEQLEEALITCARSYNNMAPVKIDAIFFSDMIRHIARLARILSLPGGGAVLLGDGACTGRSTVVRLAGFICKCKIFDIKGDSDRGESREYRSVIRQCCRLAGSQRNAILYVRDDVTDQCLRDVCSLVQDGTCIDLYSQDEFTEIALSMMPSHVTTRRLDKLEQAFDKYLRRVSQHLHIVVAFDGSDKSKLSEKLRTYPVLLKRCHGVDLYRQWRHESYVAIATRLLNEAPESIKPNGLHGNVDVVSEAMAYCHVTAREAVREQYRHLADNFRITAPSTFVEFERIFLTICHQVVKEEKVNIKKHDTSLNKVREARFRISNFENDLAKLRPKHDEAMAVVQRRVQEVELKKRTYVGALERCKREEAAIDAMMKPLNELKAKAQHEFDNINPIYFAALDALKVLDSKVIEEMRTYRAPPIGVELVVNALCLLFDRPMDWDNGKLLLMSGNFFQEMEFYDKDAMTDDVFERLERDFITNEEFTPERTRNVSRCAEAICIWVRSVYNYGVIYRSMKPRLAKLLEAEEEAKKAQAALGRRRMETQRMRTELENRIQAHKAALNAAKDIEKQIQGIERNMQRANTLMENMTLQHNLWKDELTTAQNRCLTVVGDSLLAAACVSYLGPLHATRRAKLLRQWQRRFHDNADVAPDDGDVDDVDAAIESKMDSILRTKASKLKITKTPSTLVSDSTETNATMNPLQIREEFCLEDILSDFDEQCKWRLDFNPLDLQAVQNAMFARVVSRNSSSHWPLLVDPDETSLAVVRMVLESDWSLEEVRTTRETVRVMDEKEAGPERRRSLSRLSSKSMLSTTLPPPEVDVPKPEAKITAPPGGVWCIRADDGRLQQYLVNAVVHGVAVIVTHLERRPLDAYFRDVLRKRYVTNEDDDDGGKSVKIGGKLRRVHERFSLFLSTSVPLGARGVEYCQLPLYETSLIDLTITGSGLEKLLQTHLLRLERPEFEASERGLESDIIHQRNEIRHAQEKVLQKSVTVTKPLLEEETMVEALMDCKECIEKAEAVLDDTVEVERGLDEKKQMYASVVDNAVVMYSALKKMSRLSPTYELKLADFVQVFSRAISGCQRGRGLGGDSAPRTEELYLATTAAILDKLRMRMTEDDFTLYSLLISLTGMKRAGNLTDAEEELFLAGKPGNGKAGESESESETEKPEWMTDEMSASVVYLENNLPIYTGLLESMETYAEQWEEYFKHPLVLMNLLPDPSYHKATPIERALLWRVVKPDRFSEVTSSIIKFHLGGLARTSDQYAIKDVYLLSTPRRPIILDLPSSPIGQTFVQPQLAVQQFSKEIAREDPRLRLVNLGAECQRSLAARAVRECRANGHWLVLQNLHMIGEWPAELLDEIKTLLSGSGSDDVIDWMPTPNSLSWSSPSNVTHARDVTAGVHPDFRLWIITKVQDASGQVFLPGCLMRQSVVMTTEMTSQFTNSLHRYYDVTVRAFDSWKRTYDQLGEDDELEKLAMPLALVHAVLTHRRYYQTFQTGPEWNHHDYVTVLHQVKQLLLSCRHGNRRVANLVVADAYAGHCRSVEDAVTIATLCEDALSSGGEAGAWLEKLKAKLSDLEEVEKTLELLAEPVMNLLGVNASDQQRFTTLNSRCLLDKIRVVTLASRETTSDLDDVIASVKDRWEDMMVDLPDESPDDTNPVALTFHRELDEYRTLVSLIDTDIKRLDRVLKGKVSLCPNDDVIMETLRSGHVPKPWSDLIGGQDLGLFEWFDYIERNMETIAQYANRVFQNDDVIMYHVGAMLRPERFVQAIVQQHARAAYRDLHTFKMEAQFLPASQPPVAPPSEGVYIGGLTLYNAAWDGHRNVIVHQPITAQRACAMPVVWLRPVENSSTNEKSYQCPVVTPCGRGLMTIALPTNQKPVKWHIDGVRLVASL